MNKRDVDRKGELLCRLTTDDISAHDIDLAVYLGCEDAKLVDTVGRRIRAQSNLRDQLIGIDTWSKLEGGMMSPRPRSHQAVMRTILALARQALPGYEQAMPAELSVMKPAMRDLIVKVEAYARGGLGTQTHIDEIEADVKRLNEEPGLFAEQNKRIDLAASLSLALCAAKAALGETAEAIQDAAQDVALLWPGGEGLVLKLIRTELCPWLLGDSDPLQDKPTTPQP